DVYKRQIGGCLASMRSWVKRRMGNTLDRAGAVTTAWHVLRYLGPRWPLFRACYALKIRLGWFERRWPVREWRDYSIEKFLVNPTMSEVDRYLEHRRTKAPVFFFRPQDRPLYSELLKKYDSVGRDPVREAERIEEGKFCLFSRSWVDCGCPPDWHVNPLTGQRVPADVHWSRIDHFAHGDIKCVWELSRFSFVYTLVRAYWRDGNETWAEIFWRLIEHWRESNPPNRGPQWMCGQETAIRAMAWCFGLYGFLSSPATTAKRVITLAQMLAVSAERIESNMGYALGQRNNHGVSEALGLWLIGALFPEFRRSAIWERTGRYWLERLGRELVYDDGGFCQHSANYHRMMLHEYVWALRLGDLVGHPFSNELKDRVWCAVRFLRQLQDNDSGGVPCYGANDGALVLPLENCDYRDYRPVVHAGWFQVTGRRLFKSGPWDETLIWLFGPEALEAPLDEQNQADFSAEVAGMYVLRAKESFAVVRCPRKFLHRPSHADLLHVDLWWNGVNVAVDTGTYSYNAAPPWDGALAETRFHNTVTVNEKDQMRRVGRFLWLPWTGARPGKIRNSETGNVKLWRGSHAAYSRLGRPVILSRAVAWLKGLGWVVFDRVDASDTVPCALHWLLPASVELDRGRTLRLKVRVGNTVVAVGAGVISGDMRWSVVRGDESSPRGWRSEYYQHREEATSLRVESTGSRVMFWTCFGFEHVQLNVRDQKLKLVNADHVAELWWDRDGSLVVEYGDERKPMEKIRTD
ncbi:MAG: heparinase II/III family protein, partial [Verrucomicrobiae bacterium]|nr:heparinase II/III family protein [Verrucomicrobiae bacterium]